MYIYSAAGNAYKKFYRRKNYSRKNYIQNTEKNLCGKNREWDFTAAVRPADTDDLTGGQKSEKVSKIERLLADLDKIREK